MRIERRRSTLTFRRRRRRLGCFSLALLLSIVLGLLFVSWHWLGERLNLWPTDQPRTDLAGAVQALNAGDLTTAIDRSQQIWQANPQNIDALRVLVRALIYRSYADYDTAPDRQRALAFSTEAYERLSANADVLALHAFVLQANGQATEAARIATRALRLETNHPLAQTALALSYGRVGGYDLAHTTAQTAAAIDDSFDAQRALAISFSDLGRYDDALQALDPLLADYNRLTMLQFERALYALQLGDADTATAAYFSVLAFDPDNVKARLRLCELHSTLRESDVALDYCLQTVDYAPTWAEAWYHLGREYYLRGDFALAQDNLNRCSRLQTIQGVPASERLFDCWYLQGQVAELRGDCDALTTLYAEWREMASQAALPQTWTYPPEGPAICVDPTEGR